MLELRFVTSDLRRIDETAAEVIACGVYRDTRPFVGLAGLLDWRLAGRLSKLAKEGFLVGEVGEVLAVPARPRLPYDKLLTLGLGPRASFGDATFRQVLERLRTTLSGLRVKKAVLELPGRGDGAIAPERAAELIVDLLGEEERDALTFVEGVEDQGRIEKQVKERKRTALRSDAPGPR